jgi:hypothetical protein
MEQSKYDVWSPQERGFKKQCQTCNQEFVGRKNRFYCCDQCKSRKNNDLAFDRRQIELSKFGPLLRNGEILQRIFESSDNDIVEVSMDSLERQGFNSKAPCVPFSQAGEDWFQVDEHAFRLINSERIVEIRKFQ